jgi:hypothetical protein
MILAVDAFNEVDGVVVAKTNGLYYHDESFEQASRNSIPKRNKNYQVLMELWMLNEANFVVRMERGGEVLTVREWEEFPLSMTLCASTNF